MRKILVALFAAALVTGMAPVGSSGPASGFSIVRVDVDSRAEGAYLLTHFDDTHEAGRGWVELLLHPGDQAKLDARGYTYRVVEADPVQRELLERSTPGALVQLPGPDLTDYRHLADYEAEMAALAKKNPKLVRLMKLPHESLEGRTVHGVEIAANVKKDDGRPVFEVDGVHHAREWPAGEYPMIFAHHLVEGFGKDPAITQLLKKMRVMVVPIVNVDGFEYSRESPVDAQGEAAIPLEASGTGAYWRKNRRSFSGESADAYGVDPNRNYSFHWGDDIGGSSGEHVDQTYRGEAPFSEPEPQNVRDLVLTNEVTGLVSNHTSGRLVLRPWGDTWEPSPDETILFSLGDQMSKALGGYRNIQGRGLYATTGTTSDWVYSATSALAYTIEHATSFHPPYAEEVGANWKKVMDGYTVLAKAAANPAYHSVIKGRVVNKQGRPVRATLQLHKKFETPLWPTNPTGEESVPETIHIKSTTTPKGSFAWHVSPSTRPVVTKGKEAYRLTVSAKGFTESFKVNVRRGQVLNLGRIRLAGKKVRASLYGVRVEERAAS
jgi:Zinc carboxypeptidase